MFRYVEGLLPHTVYNGFSWVETTDWEKWLQWEGWEGREGPEGRGCCSNEVNWLAHGEDKNPRGMTIDCACSEGNCFRWHSSVQLQNSDYLTSNSWRERRVTLSPPLAPPASPHLYENVPKFTNLELQIDENFGLKQWTRGCGKWTPLPQSLVLRSIVLVWILINRNWSIDRCDVAYVLNNPWFLFKRFFFR